jgi:outer membrane protein assembly factor BamD
MKLKTYITASSLLFFILFTGCSKEVEEYNKPAFYWYSQIVEQASQGDLDQADSYYSSLQGEHIGSPLLPEATMILAIAHMNHEEYLLSEYFLDEYIKRYATPNEKEEAEFLKIKAKYKALPNPRRDQALIDEALKKGEEFKLNYPDSMYVDVVNTMLTRLYLAQAVLNETIVNLYERLDKPKSAAYYKTLIDDSWIVWDDVDRANASWYRAWFEGDGTSSWYEFMIPDTKSVVSRNSISEEDVAVTETIQKAESEEKVVKPEEKEADSSSWYDFMNPFSDSDEVKEPEPEEVVEEEKEAEPEEEVTETQDDSSSWYDSMNPFSDSDDEPEEAEGSSWYNFLIPEGGSSETK